jgi:hypothetical protein
VVSSCRFRSHSLIQFRVQYSDVCYTSVFENLAEMSWFSLALVPVQKVEVDDFSWVDLSSVTGTENCINFRWWATVVLMATGSIHGATTDIKYKHVVFYASIDSSSAVLESGCEIKCQERAIGTHILESSWSPYFYWRTRPRHNMIGMVISDQNRCIWWKIRHVSYSATFW